MKKGRDNGSPGKSKIFLDKGRGKIALFLAFAALVVLLDQLSKSWIRNNPQATELLPGFLDLVYVENRGSAFGLLANQTFLLIAITIASLIIILLLLRHLSSATTLSIIPASLIFGGAMGNLIDRLRLGYVIDFIDVRLWGNFHWPAFNFADAAIVIGIFTLFYSLHQTGLFRKVYGHTHKTKN